MLMFHVQSPKTPSAAQVGRFFIQGCWSAAWARVSARRILDTLNVSLRFTLQRACHASARFSLIGGVLLLSASPTRGAPPAHDYPTETRVEFVNECIAKHGGKLSHVYQCSCVIDRIADVLPYDEFVEASTFAKYASLPGEGGGIFRDSEGAKAKAKHYREVEKKAYSDCGLEG
jgi:hypothetical protein